MGIHCWFCNDAVVVRHRRPGGGWFCPECTQYNGFTPDGDYDCALPQLADERWNPPPGRWTRLERPGDSAPGGPPPVTSLASVSDTSAVEAGAFCRPQLCAQCTRNQAAIVMHLAAFDGDECTSDADFAAKVKDLRGELERRFPLCGGCRACVATAVREIDRRVKAHWIADRVTTCADGITSGVTRGWKSFIPTFLYARRRTLPFLAAAALEASALPAPLMPGCYDGRRVPMPSLDGVQRQSRRAGTDTDDDDDDLSHRWERWQRWRQLRSRRAAGERPDMIEDPGELGSLVARLDLEGGGTRARRRRQRVPFARCWAFSRKLVSGGGRPHPLVLMAALVFVAVIILGCDSRMSHALGPMLSLASHSYAYVVVYVYAAAITGILIFALRSAASSVTPPFPPGSFTRQRRDSGLVKPTACCVCTIAAYALGRSADSLSGFVTGIFGQITAAAGALQSTDAVVVFVVTGVYVWFASRRRWR